MFWLVLWFLVQTVAILHERTSLGGLGEKHNTNERKGENRSGCWSGWIRGGAKSSGQLERKIRNQQKNTKSKKLYVLKRKKAPNKSTQIDGENGNSPVLARAKKKLKKESRKPQQEKPPEPCHFSQAPLKQKLNPPRPEILSPSVPFPCLPFPATPTTTRQK
jgi:hypothetical protein